MSDLTYGQKLVGLNFNPSKSDEVSTIKQRAADTIDQLYEIAENSTDEAEIEIAKAAIQDQLRAQMMAIKAVTWQQN